MILIISSPNALSKCHCYYYHVLSLSYIRTDLQVQYIAQSTVMVGTGRVMNAITVDCSALQVIV
jgi:hypothetical protein